MNAKSLEIIGLFNVTLAYSAGEREHIALHGIDLSIRQGEWIAVAGSNGCGKSTLAKLIAGLIRPSSGEVVCNAAGRPAIQLVFQNPETQIVGETVYEDVCFGLANYGVPPEEMEPRATDALRRVGLASRKHDFTAALSGGQKQLLNIAACLALDPSVYIFDESTSMLDPLSRQSVLHTARQLHREGRTIVWITQLLDELAWCDRVIGMKDGTIVFDGTKQSFFYGDMALEETRHKSGKKFMGWNGDVAPDKSGSRVGYTILDEPGGRVGNIVSDGLVAVGGVESGPASTAPTPCERLGFAAPFAVQTAQALLKAGYPLRPLPISPEQLGKAVSAL